MQYNVSYLMSDHGLIISVNLLVTNDVSHLTSDQRRLGAENPTKSPTCSNKHTHEHNHPTLAGVNALY